MKTGIHNLPFKGGIVDAIGGIVFITLKGVLK